jgi:hypothetical protein
MYVVGCSRGGNQAGAPFPGTPGHPHQVSPAPPSFGPPAWGHAFGAAENHGTAQAGGDSTDRNQDPGQDTAEVERPDGWCSCGALDDEGSPALPGHDQALIDQDAHSLDHGGAADAMRRGQLSNARDLLTARPLSGLDLAPELSGEPLAGKLG